MAAEGLLRAEASIVLPDPAGLSRAERACPARTLTETDLDGLAVGDDGRVYLIPDDNDPGDIYIYNLDQGFPETPIRAPLTGSDPASSGAYIYSIPELIFSDGFE